ncbi:MAG: hypothetical protein ACYTGP_08635 [Planctomycetota bacterium]|jgi:hypothetical protein
MNARFPNGRLASVLAGLTLAAVAGCASGPSFFGGSSRKVSFTNVASTPLNVTYYVKSEPMAMTAEGEAAPTESSGDATFMPQKTFQLDRGESTSFSIARRATNGSNGSPTVHLRIEPVSPSWQPTDNPYWLEILTDPPVSIVATGSEGDLTFETGEGAVAEIPQSEIESGRFEHHVAGATPSSE